MHLLCTGFFMAMDPSAQEARGLSARLLTYLLDPAAEIQCFLFWYRMDGPQIGRWHVTWPLGAGTDMFFMGPGRE